MAVKRVVVRVIFMVVEVQEEPLTDLFAFCDVLAADFNSIFVDWRACLLSVKDRSEYHKKRALLMGLSAGHL
jgi:CDP-glycerol glycerophosphotransferase (TagB/SpsB family)